MIKQNITESCVINVNRSFQNVNVGLTKCRKMFVLLEIIKTGQGGKFSYFKVVM